MRSARLTKKNIWKYGAIILLLVNIILTFTWYREYQKNKVFRSEWKSYLRILEDLKKQQQVLRLENLRRKFPLEYEKILKANEGKSLIDEKVFIISDKLLQSISLPIFE